MQNIILLFARFGAHMTFLFFTIISFLLIVNFNNDQRSIFLNSSNYYFNKLDAKTSQWESYVSLKEENDSLAIHNAELIEKFINFRETPQEKVDSSHQYDLIPSRIIRNTFHLRNNHITLDVGKNQGITKDMGVISENGILGIVRNVSDHYAHVISILNSQIRISTTIKPYAYPGNLIWKDLDPHHMTLESIPKHVKIAIGDTVVTNGYSTIFPANLPIGRIVDFNINRGSSNYNIKVRLFNNVPNEKVGYVIKNKLVEEQKEVEKLEDE